MPFTDDSYDEIKTVAVIGNYLPRLCGIATFTTDLVNALSKQAPGVNFEAVVMNDNPEGYKYPDRVRFEIQQNKLSDYSIASEYLNINQKPSVETPWRPSHAGGNNVAHRSQKYPA
jgi:hypothetical protein